MDNMGNNKSFPNLKKFFQKFLRLNVFRWRWLGSQNNTTTLCYWRDGQVGKRKKPKASGLGSLFIAALIINCKDTHNTTVALRLFSQIIPKKIPAFGRIWN